jgi:hypothetical protein
VRANFACETAFKAIVGLAQPEPDPPGGWTLRFSPVVWVPDHQRFVELDEHLALFEPPVFSQIVCAPWRPDEDDAQLRPVVERVQARAPIEAGRSPP